MLQLAINVDMGESFGRWSLCDDASLMPFITSANIACGYHAGDPVTMRRTVRDAIAHGLEIGAHVALPDLMGFGRRRMALNPEEVRDYCIYQIGALAAFTDSEGGRVGYVKPHGALYPMLYESPELADALAEGMAQLDSSMPLLLLNERVRPALEAHGIRLVVEAFADLEYDPAGNLIIERVKRAVDPELVAERALRLVREHKVIANDGGELVVDALTLCLHGDAPNSLEVVRTVRRRLDEAGVRVTPLKEILASTAAG